MAEIIEGLFPSEKVEVTEDVKELMDRIMECRKTERELSEELSQAKTRRIEAEEMLYKTLENMGAKSIRNDNGNLFYRSDLIKPYIRKDDRMKFYDWLKENGYGSLIKNTVNENTLQAFVREQYELKNPLPEYIQIHVIQKIGFRSK